MLVVRGGNPKDEFDGNLTLQVDGAADRRERAPAPGRSILTLPDEQPGHRGGAEAQFQVLSAG